MTNGHYMKKRFKCRCYEKDSSVKIYDNSETILDISYRDFDDAFYCSRKLKSVIDKLNTLNDENEQLVSELVECKALIMMLSDTTVSGRVDNLIYSRYNFYSEDEYYEKLEEYKNKVIKELKE